MASLNKRLEALEQAIRPVNNTIAVLYADPDEPGQYWERDPLSSDPGRRLEAAEKDALRGKVGTLLIVKYAKVEP